MATEESGFNTKYQYEANEFFIITTSLKFKENNYNQFIPRG